MEVTTYEVVTATGITTIVAEDNYDWNKREANLFRNLQKDSAGKDECIICGKYTSFGNNIHLSTNGYFLPADCAEPEEYEGGEGQGWFAIGSDCASKFPKGFRGERANTTRVIYDPEIKAADAIAVTSGQEDTRPPSMAKLEIAQAIKPQEEEFTEEQMAANRKRLREMLGGLANRDGFHHNRPERIGDIMARKPRAKPTPKRPHIDNTQVVHVEALIDNIIDNTGVVQTQKNIGYFEWSAPSDEVTIENAAYSNPALGITIHPDNIRAVFNDPPDVVQTEVLCRWVQSIASCVDSAKWAACSDEEFDLNDDDLTWLAIDLSPDRKFAALVGAQKLGSESFGVKLLHTWENALQLDDKAIANDLATYARKYPIEYVLYSRRTAGAVAARLAPAGIPIYDMDAAYPQACDEMLGAINSGRLHYKPNPELTAQMLSAVQLRRGDGGWVIGRRASSTAVCASVATALVTHFATRPETDLDIMVG